MSSKSPSIAAAIGLSAATFCGSNVALEAFVPGLTPTTAPRQLETSLRGAEAPELTLSSAHDSTVSSFSSALSFGAAALVAGKALSGSWSKRSVNVKRHAEADMTAPYRRDLGFAAGMVGNKHAFGDYNFDPCGFAEKVPDYLPWLREAELKHGRICMLAFLGLVAPEIIRIPGPEPCYTASIVDAHNACIGPSFWQQSGPMMQIAGWILIVEMTTAMPKFIDGITLENAGDYRLGLQFLPEDKEAADKKKMAELKNGRLAMIAFGGGITQAVVSGNGFPWIFALKNGSQQGSGLAASVPARGGPAMASASKVTMKCGEGYKMSKAVPYLPSSPALEGYPGEEDGFDPMGFSLAIDVRWLREAELKHARITMLAVLGWIATDLGMRVDGEAFQVSTIEAHDAMVKFGSMPQMLVWLGYAEVFGFLAIVNMMEGKTDRKPGDFGIRTLYPKDEAAQYDMQLRELRNGRLAMLAFSGCATVGVLTGKVWPFLDATSDRRSRTTFGLGSTMCGGIRSSATRSGAVATRALEASRSLPYLPKPKNLAGWVGEEAEFDPLGFSETFDMKWLREAELKHGRVTMIATVGFVAQQYISFPGWELVPNANDAPALAPPYGPFALLAACGWIESTAYNGKLTMLDMFEDKTRVPGDLNFGTGMLNNVSEARAYDLKLKELNNGRLAMMAFGGMVHHNLVVREPLFPIFPEDWKGPQGSWQLESVMGAIVEGRIGNEMIPPGYFP